MTMIRPVEPGTAQASPTTASGARRRERLLLVAFVVAVVGLLGVGSWQLARSQSHQRRDLRDRYASRAPIATALIDSLFKAAFTQQTRQNTRRYGGAVVPVAALQSLVKQSNAVYAMVTDGNGRVLAATPSAPPAVRSEGLSSYRREALTSGYGLSDLMPGPMASISSAVVFPGADGAKRLLITASPAKVFQLFLAGSLKPLAAGVEGGSAFILDGTGHPLAAVGRETRPDPKVAAAAAKHTSGTVSARGEQFFAANPVPSSRWRVLVAAPTDKLYASASGTGRWLPWVILGICGLALLAIGLLLHRLLGATAECAETNVHLARANNELRRSNSDLEQFSYVSSHDLSTPLRSVAGMSQLLATKYRGQLDEEADKYIGFMEEGVNRMQRIIDDLLEYSRVDSRDLEPAPVNLEQLVDELLRDLAPVIAERHAEVTRDPVPTIQGDRGQLGQVLQNLLVNALTFTAPGTAPKVHVSAQRDGTAWRVSVADNGIGVDPEHRERIFKMFQRLNRDTDYPGTGIGLAITKKMVERHGGDVTVEPGPDGGSVFSFTLPIEPTPARQAVSA